MVFFFNLQESLIKPCSAYEKSCYVIDNNGYIVVSENSSDTGRFFGDVEWRAMLELVELHIFKNITIYDYQAVCIKDENGKGDPSSASLFITVRLDNPHSNEFFLIFSFFILFFAAIYPFEKIVTMAYHRDHSIIGQN